MATIQEKVDKSSTKYRKRQEENKKNLAPSMLHTEDNVYL